MRRGIVLCAALLTSACADPIVSTTAELRPVGNWRVEKQTDRISGAPIASAMLVAKASHAGEPFPQDALLQLSCFREQAVARFAFPYKIGSERNVEFGYRFDEKPGRQAVVHVTQDYRTAVIEDQDEIRPFIADMETSQTLYVLIRSLNAGRTSVEFKLDGAAEAISTAYARCPIKPPAPPDPPKSSKSKRRR